MCCSEVQEEFASMCSLNLPQCVLLRSCSMQHDVWNWRLIEFVCCSHFFHFVNTPQRQQPARLVALHFHDRLTLHASSI